MLKLTNSFKNFCYWRVIYFSAILFIIEILFSYLLGYILDYFKSMLIISYALLGIGIGSLISSKIKTIFKNLFLYCCAGTVSAFIISLFIIIRLSHIWYLHFILSFPFIFLSIYLSLVFREYMSNRIYFNDMFGAFSGICIIVLCFSFINVEILILFLLILQIMIIFIELKFIKIKKFYYVTRAAVIVIILVLISGIAYQFSTDNLNIVYIIECNDTEDNLKIFCNLEEPEGNSQRFIKSYDSLVARVDITMRTNHERKYKIFNVYYNGLSNDNFNNSKFRYTMDMQRDILDRRVVTGLINNPKVMILGSSAQGISKMITGYSNDITALEINPAVITIMTRDFYNQSGRAYDGLEVFQGNGISYLKRTDVQFDIITLMNTHSMSTIGYIGPPDYLHTTETYELYFDHLSDDGYLMLEERPVTERGKYGIKRIIVTIYKTLQNMGYVSPEEHFFIYSWQGERNIIPDIGSIPEYVSILVTKNPISENIKESILKWTNIFITKESQSIRLDFLSNTYDSGEYSGIFNGLINNALSIEYTANIDLTPVVNNRPFASQVYLDYSELNEIFYPIGTICLLFIIILSGMIIYRKKNKSSIALIFYNICIGTAFFLLEILLIQKYQNIFMSVTGSLVIVLGLFLISSGIGGLFLSREKYYKIFRIALLIISAINFFSADYIILLPLPDFVKTAIFILLIILNGICIGVFFPYGLILAKKNGLKKSIPLYFGINSIAGTFGVVLSLHLSVIFGFLITLVLALILFIASILISRLISLT